MQTLTDVSAPERKGLKARARTRDLRALFEARFPRWTDDQLADALDMSKNALIRTRRNMGFLRKSDQPEITPEIRAKIAGMLGVMPYEAIAAELDIPLAWVKAARRELGAKVPNLRLRIVWTAEQDAELLALNAEGIDPKQIGKRIGRPKHHVEARLDVLSRPPLVERACLNCETTFMAEGKFMRLCTTCRAMG